nr:MAG TPA: hypothetical protein [Caudoviricetes sp.]
MPGSFGCRASFLPVKIHREIAGNYLTNRPSRANMTLPQSGRREIHED